MIRLKEFRLKNGFSQQELAFMVGVKASTISNYEQGIREPDIETMIKIAIVLNVTVDELISFQEMYEKMHDELNKRIQQKEKEPKS
jgi:transcriptional regulator with XRE-family HTH domain